MKPSDVCTVRSCRNHFLLGFWIVFVLRKARCRASSSGGQALQVAPDDAQVLATLCLVARDEMWTDGLDLFVQLRQACLAVDSEVRFADLRRAETLLVRVRVCAERRAAVRLGRWLARRADIGSRSAHAVRTTRGAGRPHTVSRRVLEAVGLRTPTGGELVPVGCTADDAVHRALVDSLEEGLRRPVDIMEGK